MGEEDAIRRCQNGDREAFRFVVDHYGRVLFGTAYMMTRDRPLSEDLAQEALLLAWRNIASFEIGTNLKAWLLREHHVIIGKPDPRLRVLRPDVTSWAKP